MKTPGAFLLICCVLSSAALAEGLALSPAELPTAERASLREEIERARQASPRGFQSLDSLARQMSTLDARKRGRYAPVTQTLRLLGKDLLFPALEMLVWKAPPQALSEGAALSLKMGLIEATGELTDARAAPVWKALLADEAQKPEVHRSAAEALGRLGTDEAARELILRSKGQDARALAVQRGMGSCRRLDVARRLAQAAEEATNEKAVLAAIAGLGDVGNSWAFRLEKNRTEEAPVRDVAARALVQAFVRHGETVQKAASNALMVVDAPSTRSFLQAAGAPATASRRRALEALARRFEHNPVR